MDNNSFSEITPEIIQLAKLSEQAGVIDSELFTKYEVKRGLRDLNGKGVLAGLTNISDVKATEIVNGVSVPAHGRLIYRGYDVKDLVGGFTKEDRFGFEEVAYLLLFNKLPSEKELADFRTLLANYRTLPTSFVRDIIMKAPSKDMMNTLARSVLTLYSYDDLPEDTSVRNVLRQSLQPRYTAVDRFLTCRHEDKLPVNVIRDLVRVHRCVCRKSRKCQGCIRCRSVCQNRQRARQGKYQAGSQNDKFFQSGSNQHVYMPPFF